MLKYKIINFISQLKLGISVKQVKNGWVQQVLL
ncbi:hypothetical protein ES705_17628 [subsurface metagenome]|jgi:hypothetical protein